MEKANFLNDMVAHGVIHRDWDDSYVVLNNTYHVPKNIEEFQELWKQIDTWAKGNPDKVREELPPPAPTEEERQTGLAAALRYQRDQRIAATDYLIMPDYSGIDEATKMSWTAYRKALRNLPQQEGFPWDGGGRMTPWPASPAENDEQGGGAWNQ